MESDKLFTNKIEIKIKVFILINALIWFLYTSYYTWIFDVYTDNWTLNSHPGWHLKLHHLNFVVQEVQTYFRVLKYTLPSERTALT